MSSERLSADEIATKLADYLAPLIADALKDAVKTCFNCQNFSEPRTFCVKFQQLPPPKVVAFGCPSFEEIIAPF